MTKVENFEEQTLERQRLALDAMFEGDPEPYMETWSQRDPVSLFGAWGPCKTGWSELSETFRWVGSRFGGGDMSSDLEVAYAGEDLAYTVGYERGEVAVDGGEKRPMTLRVTQIYRREDGKWKLVHRHADFAPADESLH
jgi:ketosteroid isomerase-like protein